ncbi:adenylate/guanylate cyclase [Caballeronia calidae]|uniref:Adenylate/guanylate cyclase n=1 Tax=Caballeronia calidae TaxID=1777139 RepID=A0A158EHH9_9BURK|nr:AAA family ATPase [Caballeronia calidae]SAL06342.1 adenylate/guanylate cyclase [Caballeronia calidae]
MGKSGRPADSFESLSIRLLGELELRRDGMTLQLPASRRTRGLLGYLVMAGGAVARSTLCDLLWDGPDDPRAALRWSLTKLRPLVDGESNERIVADRATVAFFAGGAFLDTAKVEALLEAGAEALTVAELEEASRLLHGDFLAGLDLPACYRFHNWCVGQRERFGRMRATVLRALIGKLVSDPGLALQYGRELVEANPLDETAHGTLITLLNAAGRRSDAEVHFSYAREFLRRELGAGGGAVLDDSIRCVRQRARVDVANDDSHREERPQKAAPTNIAPPVSDNHGTRTEDQEAASTLPLVGREKERARLDAVLSSAAGGGLTLLTGEPGIGKTRLLEYFSDRASSAGFRVLRGRCYEAEAIRPYGIWIDALRSAATEELEVAGADLAPIIHSTATSTEAAGDRGDRERFFEAVVAMLNRMLVAQRLAIALDDLQWLDEASAALLHFVLRRLVQGLPVAFVATARPAETEDNRWAHTLLQALSRDGKLGSLPLTPLSVPEVGALLAATGKELNAEQVVRASGGNPLYVLELTRIGSTDIDESARPVDTLIVDRLAPLDPSTRELLSFAAAVGHEFRPDQLAELVDRPIGDGLLCLADLERRRLLAPKTETAYDFAHDLVRQTVYRTLSGPHRGAIHHQIARQLLAASAEDPRLHGEVVHHATMAGDSRMTARASVEASNHCLRVFAAAEARAVAERGLAHARALPKGRERIRLEIQLLSARLAAAASSGDRRPVSVEQELEQAIQEAEALSLHADVVEGLYSLSWLTQQANDIERTRQVTIRAENAARKADASTRCRQLANTGRCLLDLERDLRRARGVLKEASAMAEELDLRIVELMWGEALLARADGDLDTGCARLSAAVAHARAVGDHWREYQCLVWLATMRHEHGAHEAVREMASSIVAAAQKMGDSGAPFADVMGAVSSLRLGDGDTRGAITTGLDALRQADDKRHLCYALNEVALAVLDVDDGETASAYATEALQAAEALSSPTEMVVATAILIETAFAAGDGQRAETLMSSLRGQLNVPWLSPRSKAAIQRLRDRFPVATTGITTQHA